MNANLDWRQALATPRPSIERETLSRRLRDLDAWLTFVAGLMAVIAVAVSMQSADWVESMPSLPLVAALGLGAGFVSARLPGSAVRRAWTAIAAMLGAGFVVVVGTTISAIETGGDPWERWNAFRDRMAIWWDVVIHGGISDDQIPFILLVVSVAWLVSFATAWSLFALRSAWLAMVPLGLVIVLNNAYRELDFEWSFVVFSFAALLLFGRTAFERLRGRWANEGTVYPDFIGLQAFWRSAWVGALLLLGAWMLPSNSGERAFGGVWERVGEAIDERVFDSGRFFAAVRGTRGEPFRDFGEVLPLGGAIDLRDRQQLRATLSEDVPFLRVLAYERYDGNGWLTDDRRESTVPAAEVLDPADLGGIDEADRRPGLVIAEIEVRRPQGWLAAPGAPIAADRTFEAEIVEPQSFVLPLDTGVDVPAEVPGELRDLLPTLRDLYLPPGPGSGAVFGAIRDALPGGYRIRALEHDPPRLTIERDTGIEGALALAPDDDLDRGDRYRIAAIVANAPADELRAAGEDYPEEMERFLQLPDDFPASVSDLAREVTEGASTPYDRAVAIETYLRRFSYDETIRQPTPGFDRVEQFLFGTQRGYFDYHASAMTVMLRAVGVPSRLATGYYVDEQLDDGRFVLRERHTYSWPEVYFPEIGWVQFNPTPNLPPVARPDAEGLVGPEIDPSERGNEFGFGEIDLDAFNDLGQFPVGDGGAATAIPSGDSSSSLAWIWAALGLVGIGLFSGGAYIAWERSVAGLPYPAKLWEKTIRFATLTGSGPRKEQTPREFAQELQERLDGEPAVGSLVRAYEGARFGQRAPQGEELAQLRRDYRTVRGRLLRKVLRWRSRTESGEADG